MNSTNFDMHDNSSASQRGESRFWLLPSHVRIIFLCLFLMLLAFLTAFAVGLLRGNVRIAQYVKDADREYSAGNYYEAFEFYKQAHDSASARNTSARLPFNAFGYGEKTLVKQFETIEKYSGPIAASNQISNLCQNGEVPESLSGFVTRANTLLAQMNEISSSANIVNNDDNASFNLVCTAIDSVSLKNPDYPEYLFDYYKTVYAYISRQPIRVQYKYYNDLVSKAPEEKWLYRNYGIKILAASGKYDEALALCDKVNKNALLYVLEISTYRLMENYDKALAVCDEADEKLGASIGVARERAIVHILSGDTKAAVNDLSAFSGRDTITRQSAYILAVCAVIDGDAQAYSQNEKTIAEKFTQTENGVSTPGKLAQSVIDFKAGKLDIEDLFLNGESELS